MPCFQVPTFKHKNQEINESMAICEYLQVVLDRNTNILKRFNFKFVDFNFVLCDTYTTKNTISRNTISRNTISEKYYF